MAPFVVSEEVHRHSPWRMSFERRDLGLLMPCNRAQALSNHQEGVLTGSAAITIELKFLVIQWYETHLS